MKSEKEEQVLEGKIRKKSGRTGRFMQQRDGIE